MKEETGTSSSQEIHQDAPSSRPHPHRKRRWSTARISATKREKIKTLSRSKKTYRDIAEEVGVSVASVLRYKDPGIKRRWGRRPLNETNPTTPRRDRSHTCVFVERETHAALMGLKKQHGFKSVNQTVTALMDGQAGKQDLAAINRQIAELTDEVRSALNYCRATVNAAKAMAEDAERRATEREQQQRRRILRWGW